MFKSSYIFSWKVPYCFKVCCGSLNFYVKQVNTTLKKIYVNGCKRFDKEYELIPGKKLCHRCCKTLKSQIEQNPFPYVDPEYEPDVDGDTNKPAKLNEPLIALSCNPN